MATAVAERLRPRLKDIDDLFLLNQDSEELDSESSQAPKKHFQLEVNLNLLTPFSKHPFHLYEGERLEDMVESIKTNGVLIPIIVRKKDGVLEILAGHNRVNASRIAGLVSIPAIILKDITDEEAWIYVIETNLMQRSFADMSHSEKAAVISVQHSKLFSQGKRNDILVELKALENPDAVTEKETSPQVGERLHSDKRVGEMYSLSKNTVARYLRVHQLISELKNMLDYGIIAFIPAVTISFLKEREQRDLAQCIEMNKLKVDMKKADILRDYSNQDKLNAEQIYFILNGELVPKTNKTPAIKMSETVYSRYFQPDQPAKEVQNIVEKALEFYFSQQ